MTLLAIPGGDGVREEPDWSQTYSDVLDLTEAHEQWGLVVRSMQTVQTLAPDNGPVIELLVRPDRVRARGPERRGARRHPDGGPDQRSLR